MEEFTDGCDFHLVSEACCGWVEDDTQDRGETTAYIYEVYIIASILVTNTTSRFIATPREEEYVRFVEQIMLLLHGDN